MTQIAHGADFSHARAALEGVQIALQRGQRQRVVRIGQPTVQCLPGAVENIHRLFEEDFHDLVIEAA